MNALVLALLCPPSPSPVSQEPLSLGCIPELQRTCSVSVQGNMRSVHVDTVAGTGLFPKWQLRMQAELSFTAEVVLASVSPGAHLVSPLRRVFPDACVLLLLLRWGSRPAVLSLCLNRPQGAKGCRWVH